jgi:hypothetical protein
MADLVGEHALNELSRRRTAAIEPRKRAKSFASSRAAAFQLRLGGGKSLGIRRASGSIPIARSSYLVSLEQRSGSSRRQKAAIKKKRASRVAPLARASAFFIGKSPRQNSHLQPFRLTALKPNSSQLAGAETNRGELTSSDKTGQVTFTFSFQFLFAVWLDLAQFA